MTKNLFIITLTLSGIFLDSNNVGHSPCSSMGTDTTYEYIQQVTLNTIDNISGNNGGYEDFSNIKTDLVIGQTYEITLFPGHTGSAFNESWKVWIDYNNDGDYDDEGEEVISLNDVKPIISTITIPDDITARDGVAMRVSMQYNNAALPCQIFTYGEVEDYTIILTDEEVPCADDLSDGFESGYGNWNDGSTDCTRVTEHANTGKWSIRLRDNSGASSSMTTNDLALSAYDEVTIDFSYYPNSMENGEDFWLQISTDGGSSYTTVRTWASGTDFYNEMRYNESVTIDNVKLSDNTRIRLRCDATANADQVFIDDVIISVCSSDDHVIGIENINVPDIAIVLPDLLLPVKSNRRNNVEKDSETVIEFGIYPNPARDNISFKIIEGKTNNELYDIKLISIFGKTIMHLKSVTLMDNYKLDISGITNGMYVVIIENKDKIVDAHKVLVTN
ncbi:MAG: hypothetical protein ACI86M_001694 [Saprospiraceae bacterium]|jgi:hypothetical protein